MLPFLIYQSITNVNPNLNKRIEYERCSFWNEIYLFSENLKKRIEYATSNVLDKCLSNDNSILEFNN